MIRSFDARYGLSSGGVTPDELKRAEELAAAKFSSRSGPPGSRERAQRVTSRQEVTPLRGAARQRLKTSLVFSLA